MREALHLESKFISDCNVNFYQQKKIFCALLSPQPKQNSNGVNVNKVLNLASDVVWCGVE